PDPTVVMTAPAPIPFGIDELAIAGALRGKPLELVPCKTIPLEVPAMAEIVIEGEIRPGELREEGPFGEFTGHYGGHKAPRPVIHADIDPFDPIQVEWAVATRVQANRDIEILKQLTGIILDPSLPKEEQWATSRTSKMIIDATRYDAKNFPPVCSPASETMAKVEKEWKRYGILLPGK